jgi:translation elongation factor EF-Tu-like GTPase
MSELLNSVTQKLIDDKEFLNIVEKKIKEIMKDGKITTQDIPNITLIVVHATNNLKSFNLTYNELNEILLDTIVFILDYFKVIAEEDKDDIVAMIKSCVELTMMQPKVKNCLVNVWNKLLCRK